MVMKARDIVEKDFISLPKDTTAYDAAKSMKERGRGFVVVADANGKPEGMVTEWDFLSKLIAEGRDPAGVRLGEIMTANLVTVKAEEELDSVAQLMSMRRVRRVLVVQNGKVLGIITARTMLAKMKRYIDRISAQIARLQMPQV
jgi:CBS domain-containing protein